MKDEYKINPEGAPNKKVVMAKKMTKESKAFPKEFRRHSSFNYDLKKITKKLK